MRFRRQLIYTIAGWAKHRIVSHGVSQLVARAPRFIVLRHTQISKLGQQPMQTIGQNTVRSSRNVLICTTSLRADAGLHPEPINDIPPQLIAMMRTNINVQDLTVQALLTENRDHIYHAAMLDPRTAAELDLAQIRRLVDDLLAAHCVWLPDWLKSARGGMMQNGSHETPHTATIRIQKAFDK